MKKLTQMVILAAVAQASSAQPDLVGPAMRNAIEQGCGSVSLAG